MRPTTPFSNHQDAQPTLEDLILTYNSNKVIPSYWVTPRLWSLANHDSTQQTVSVKNSMKAPKTFQCCHLESFQVVFSFLRLSIGVEADAGKRVLGVPGSTTDLVEVSLKVVAVLKKRCSWLKKQDSNRRWPLTHLFKTTLTYFHVFLKTGLLLSNLEMG